MQRKIKQTNTILIILLVAQLALVFYVFRPSHQGTRAEGLLLTEFPTEKISGFTITDNESQGITLEKTPAGWFIKPAINEFAPLPADSDKVNTLLIKVESLTRNRLVTRTQASHNRLKVGQLFNRKIEFKAAEDKQRILFLGSAPNYKSLHVRLDGEDEVYLAKDLSIWEAPTAKESWWRTDYLDLDPEKLTGVELINPNETIILNKDAEGSWQLDGQPTEMELNQASLQTFLNDLTHLTILEYLPADFQPSAKKSIATLKLTLPSEVVTLTIAPKDEEKEDHLVKSSQTAYFAKAAVLAVKDILQIKANDLINPKVEVNSAVQ